jgi:hypothetical protein
MVKTGGDDDDKKNRPSRTGPPWGWLNVNQQRSYGDDVLRIALLNTPRSGSTWLRCLLSTLLDLEQLTAFVPDDIDWQALPERAVIHLHAHRTPAMLDLLERHAIRPVVLRRHPLDVLISILHFAPHEPATARWLDGEGGDERLLYGAAPMSQNFLRYAKGARAKALLSLSPEWARDERAVEISYERLVAATVEELDRITCELSVKPVRDLRWTTEQHSLARHRAASRNQHYWRGQPGLWRHLLTHDVARDIHNSLRESFDAFGYACDADPQLTLDRAHGNWSSLRAA